MSPHICYLLNFVYKSIVFRLTNVSLTHASEVVNLFLIHTLILEHAVYLTTLITAAHSK